jgi:hypothetical protein
MWSQELSHFLVGANNLTDVFRCFETTGLVTWNRYPSDIDCLVTGFSAVWTLSRRKIVNYRDIL